ncbi:MAG: FHA domain-containing protein [Deltaproteobacteria bacterium]|nr:FHA domain-containing protein [Deltaproteobacteria bacterium]
MQDGRTRKLPCPSREREQPEFFSLHRAALVILEGSEIGSEFPLEQEQVIVGRGPGVDLTFQDGAMSCEHAALERIDGGYRVRDLASSNGVYVNSCETLLRELEHGDLLQIGGYVFQYLVEDKERPARVFDLPDA